MASPEKTFWDLIAALEAHPEWKARLRQMLLSEELLRLPEQVAKLERSTQESFKRTWDALSLLTEDLRQLTQRVDQLTQRVDQLTQRVDQLAEDLRQLTQRVDQLTQRVDQLAEDLRQLTQRVDQLTQRVDQLAEDLRQLTQRVDQLTQRVDQLTQRVDRLTAQMEQLTKEVGALVSWQRGEEGRRRGEAYERKIIRSAPRLFHGGDGGPPTDPVVRRKLTRWLRDYFDELEDEEVDVFLADLIWWKGDKVAVVEISWKVNGKDVECAYRRAEVLRKAGVDAFGLVVGQDWAVEDARKRAEERGVAWYIEGEPSTPFIHFRKLKES